MKKKDLFSYLYTLALPAGLVILGAVLVLIPDLATVLLSKILGWGILAVGFGFALAALVRRGLDLGKLVTAAVCIAAGSFLAANPLWLARSVGLVLGILLLLRGGRDVLRSNTVFGKALSGAMAGLGLVLMVLPMTVSRWVFSLCGLVMVIVGICMAVDKLRTGYLPEGNDPNIIDAL